MNEIIIGAIDMSPYFEQKKGVKFIFRGVPFETIKTLRLLVEHREYDADYTGVAVKIRLTKFERLGWVGASDITWKRADMFYFNMVFYRRGVNFDNLKWELWHE